MTKSSWAWSCAIRVNWTRNSRSALASRWFTVEIGSKTESRRAAPAAEGREGEEMHGRCIANSPIAVSVRQR